MTTIFEQRWWIASRTMWFNVLCSLAGLAVVLLPALQTFLSVKAMAIVVAVVNVVNIILRVLTEIKLGAK